jgi:hypothetical protein
MHSAGKMQLLIVKRVVHTVTAGLQMINKPLNFSRSSK